MNHRNLLAALALAATLTACAGTKPSSTPTPTGISKGRAVQIAQNALVAALGPDFEYRDNISVATDPKDATKWLVIWTGGPKDTNYHGSVVVDKTTGKVDNVQTAH